jgi:hypothetical protein
MRSRSFHHGAETEGNPKLAVIDWRRISRPELPRDKDCTGEERAPPMPIRYGESRMDEVLLARRRLTQYRTRTAS